MICRARKSRTSIVIQLVFSAVVYHLWRERVFQHKCGPMEADISTIEEDIQAGLMGLNKLYGNGEYARLCAIWNLPLPSRL